VLMIWVVPAFMFSYQVILSNKIKEQKILLLIHCCSAIKSSNIGHPREVIELSTIGFVASGWTRTAHCLRSSSEAL
jgi:hypothetical protein